METIFLGKDYKKCVSVEDDLSKSFSSKLVKALPTLVRAM